MDRAVNCEEFIGKTVGRRVLSGDPFVASTILQETAADLCHLRIKRGVYRFHSHEEADRWLMDQMTRRKGN